MKKDSARLIFNTENTELYKLIFYYFLNLKTVKESILVLVNPEETFIT